MNQPGESEIQKTPVQEAPVAPFVGADGAVYPRQVGKGDMLKALANYGDNRFLFYGGSKRKVARLLVDYVEEALDSFAVYLREEMPENLFTRGLAGEQLESLWWAGDTMDRINRLRTKIGDDYECHIWDFGVGDATLLLPVGDRNKTRGYGLLDAIMRECWECRHKMTMKEKRKKIKEMKPLTQEFFDHAEIDHEDY